jgi:hypothetical protein
VREDAQEEISFAVQNRILKPAVSLRVIRKKAVGQRLLQRANRNGIQLPESRIPGEVIRSGSAHALARLPISGKRLGDSLKWLPDDRLRASVGPYAVDCEFVGTDVSTPLDQSPGLFSREIGWGQVPFN